MRLTRKDLSKAVFEVILTELPGLEADISDEKTALYELVRNYMTKRGEEDNPSQDDGLTNSSVWLLLIFLGLEERFEIEISDSESLAVETFEDLVKLVDAKLLVKQSASV